MIFFIASSILFLGYIQIRDLCFGTIIAFLGFFSCPLAWWHFKDIPQRLERLENQLDAKLKVKLGLGGGRIKGRNMALWVIPIFFALVWFFSILYSFGIIH